MTPWITWKSYYSVGEPSLDNQHKKILALVSEVYEAVERRDDDAAVRRVLEELSRYELTHFRYEEQLMRDCGYPHVAEHSALHEEFRTRPRLGGRSQPPHRPRPPAVPQGVVGRPHPVGRQEVHALLSSGRQPAIILG